MFDDIEKTEWIEGDTPPVHPGIYEWEKIEQFFDGQTVCVWTGSRWEISWSNGFISGRVIMQECPTRWRGRSDPPVDVLLEC